MQNPREYTIGYSHKNMSHADEARRPQVNKGRDGSQKPTEG